MSDFNRNHARAVPMDRADMSVDAGLRSFMLGVYNKLGLGLVLTAALAWATGLGPLSGLLFSRATGVTALGWVVTLAPLGIILFGMGFARTARGASIMYWLLTSLIGASMGTIFIRYNLDSISLAFLSTAVAFGGLSLFGYTTKKDLTGLGTFMMMGLIGVIGLSLISMVAGMLGFGFMNSGLSFMINIAVVVIFAGFMAYDTQRLKMMYYQVAGDVEAMGVATSMGALSLYLNIINMFQALLAIFGGNRN